jgi:transcriptional regulator with XRE-family HTH domain
MKHLAMKQGTLYQILRGEVVPNVGTAYRIAAALGVTIDRLMIGCETAPEKI